MAPPRSVTPPDAEVLRLIVDRTEAEGFPPTVRELADVIGLASPGAMHRHVVRLRRADLVTGGDRRNERTLAVTDAGLAILERCPPTPA